MVGGNLFLLCADRAGQETALRPGLITSFTDSKNREATTLEPVVGLTLEAGAAPHPSLADLRSVHWDGILMVPRTAAYEFSALVVGKVQVHVDGKEVLTAQAGQVGTVTGPTLELKAGPNAFTAHYTRAQGNAQVLVSWKASFLYKEPLGLPALVHAAASLPQHFARARLIERGRLLAEEHSCARCHQPDSKMGQGLEHNLGPDLSTVGARLFPGAIYRWLQNPREMAPWASMPALFGADAVGRAEAYAVAAVSRNAGRPACRCSRSGRQEREWPARRHPIPASRLCGLPCARQLAPPEDRLLPAPRSYVLADLGNKTTPERLAKYLLDPLAVAPGGRMPAMGLTETEALDVAHFLCNDPEVASRRQLPGAPGNELMEAAFRRVEGRAEQLLEFKKLPAALRWPDLGKRIVIERGCNNCHTIAPGGQPFANVFAEKSLEDLATAKKPGCLETAEKNRGRAPWFGVTEMDQAALRAFLTDGLKGPGTPAPRQAALSTLTRLNCLACHVRDGEGGLPIDLLEELRKLDPAPDAEAVNAPPLTGAGSKLRPEWLESVLTKGARARPWLGLRMPQFGKENVNRLIHGLADLEGVAPPPKDRTPPLENIASGQRLVGKAGFHCVACHDHAGVQGTVRRGTDLGTISQRLTYDWFRRWLQQPTRMQPGTSMPSIFPDGHSTFGSILGGDPDAQARAMWDTLRK